MIDSHCHLNFKNLKNNIDTIINNAIKNDIKSILSINTDPEEFYEHYNLIKDYKSIFISYGLHPENVSKNKNISKNLILENTKNEKVIGIGETGLDFYHSNEFIKEQYESFEAHIESSIETNLPLIIHQRNSENQIMEVLKNYQKKYNLRVVLHCFTGSAKFKNFCLDNDYYISLSGILTFKNANELREVIKEIPLSSLLIETDSPFLSPVPFRGKVNEPSYVKYIAEYLSKMINKPLNEIIEITNENFYKLFTKAIRYNKISK